MANRKKVVRRRPRLGKFSMAQLLREIGRRQQAAIGDLRKERAKHEKVISEIDRQIADLAGKGQAKPGRRPGRKPRRTRHSAKMKMQALWARVSRALRRNKAGLSVGQLAKAAGASVGQLQPLLKKLLAEKKVRKVGVARGTKYLAAS